MFGIKPVDEGRGAKVREVRAWVREHARVAEDTTVMVTELRCTEPGCPPVETVIAVLWGPGRSAQAKVHRPITEITRDDVAALSLQDPGGQP